MAISIKDYSVPAALGVTQIIGYGTLMYAYSVLLPEMADDLGLSLSAIFGVLSLALLFGGLLSPIAGHLVDRYGGRYVMTVGSGFAVLALLLMSQVDGARGIFFAILLAEAAAMFVLYNVAFAAVARLDSPLPAARAISVITLFGGIASTIFWPFTLYLHGVVGWQNTWIVLGALVIVVCVPIHFFMLAGPSRGPDRPAEPNSQSWPQLTGQARRRGMLWMVLSFVFSGYLMGAVMTLWVTNVQDLGHTAAAAALAGAVIGPFKTVGRGFEMLIGRNLHPRATYLLSMALQLVGFLVLLSFGFSFVGILLAAAIYGMGDGIKTIARGTLPLALFGEKGYGARLGWISFVQMAVNASAPFTFAYLTQTYGGWWSFATMSLFVIAALAAFVFIPDPRTPKVDRSENRQRH